MPSRRLRAIRLSVVIPAHNEELYLEAAVREVAEGLRVRGRSFEVLVVENGSRDGTARLATRLEQDNAEVKALSLPRPNYGRALRVGLLAAQGQVVANFDADYYDLDFLDQALVRLEDPDGPDLVVGTKRSPGAVDRRPWTRRFITAGFAAVMRHGFGLRISDTHGMKAMRRSPLSELAGTCRFDGDLFDTELVLRAERGGLRVEELPVVVEERRPARTSVTGRIVRSLGALLRLRWLLWRESSAVRRRRPV